MALYDPDLRRLRALKMLEMKLRNTPNRLIAKHFNVGIKVVERALTELKRAGLIVQAEDRLLTKLLPKAEQVIEKALEDDLKAEVTTGQLAIKLYDKAVKGRDAKHADGISNEDELVKYMREKRQRAQLEEDTVDGELTSGINTAVAELARTPLRSLISAGEQGAEGSSADPGLETDPT